MIAQRENITSTIIDHKNQFGLSERSEDKSNKNRLDIFITHYGNILNI